MNLPLAYAIIAMVCYGLSDFVYKQAASAKIRSDHFIMVQAWFFCPSIILYCLFAHKLVFAPIVLWGSLAGFASFVGLYYFSRSLASGAVSTNASIFRMNFIVTVVLVVAILGEPFTTSKAAGLALALLSTHLLMKADGTSETRSVHARSLVEIAVATLAFGAANFFHTVGLRHGAVPDSLVAAQAAVFMPLATMVVFSKDRRLAPRASTFRFSAPAAFLQLGATLMLLHAIALGQASVLVPIAQMGLVVAALLGMIVLKEKATRRKLAGLVLAVAALAALAVS